MRKNVILMLLCLISTISFANKYDVAHILYKEQLERGTKALNTYNSVVEINYILLPTKIDEGRYTINVTRVDSNLYRIDDTDLYIETKFCYEYCYSEEVLLIIRNYGNYSYGTLVFFD